MHHSEHVQAIREGRDYFAPQKALNQTIEGLVNAGLIVRSHEDGTLLTAEARALDAIGTQVLRELKTRYEMVVALADRLTAVEAQLHDAKNKGYKVPPELEYQPRPQSMREAMERGFGQRPTIVQEHLGTVNDDSVFTTPVAEEDLQPAYPPQIAD